MILDEEIMRETILESRPAGYQFLTESLGIEGLANWHQSFVAYGNSSQRMLEEGQVIEWWTICWAFPNLSHCASYRESIAKWLWKPSTSPHRQNTSYREYKHTRNNTSEGKANCEIDQSTKTEQHPNHQKRPRTPYTVPNIQSDRNFKVESGWRIHNLSTGYQSEVYKQFQHHHQQIHNSRQASKSPKQPTTTKQPLRRKSQLLNQPTLKNKPTPKSPQKSQHPIYRTKYTKRP